MSSMIIIGGLLFAGKVANAFPQFYNDRTQGCTIPTQGFKGHGAPEPNADIAVTITDADGAPVQFWVSGETYTLEVASYTDATNCWVHSDAGTLEVSGDAGALADCGEAWHSGMTPAATHVMTWTAPVADEGCGLVSIAQAASPSDAYQTATMEFCTEGGAMAPGAAPDMAAAVPLEEDEGVVEGAVEGDAAAPEDEAAATDTSAVGLSAGSALIGVAVAGLVALVMV